MLIQTYLILLGFSLLYFTRCCIFYKLKARSPTSKMIAACSVAMLTLLWLSGAEPAVSQRYVCTFFIFWLLPYLHFYIKSVKISYKHGWILLLIQPSSWKFCFEFQFLDQQWKNFSVTRLDSTFFFFFLIIEGHTVSLCIHSTLSL